MKKICSVVFGIGALTMALWVGLGAAAPPAGVTAEECFFLRSLHYTAEGMGFWYGKRERRPGDYYQYPV